MLSSNESNEKSMAISIRQPWATLIVLGLKSVEIRSWSTNFRGRLFLHASKQIDSMALKRFPLDNLQLGCLVGTAELARIEPMTRELWDELADEHLDLGPFREGLFAWHFTSPGPLHKPMQFRGKPGIFPVSFEIFQTDNENQQVDAESSSG